MNLARTSISAAAIFVFLLGGCGDDRTASTTSTAGGEIAHPTGAGDTVVRIGYEGGMLANANVTQIPSLVIAGDGTVYTAAMVPAIYPGALMPSVVTDSISEAGVQRVLAKANDLGLLATPRDYSAETTVADAPDTVVTLNAAGGSFEHRAYALGINPETSLARQDLLEFVNAASDLPALTGEEESGSQPFVPTSVRLSAAPVDRATIPTDVTPQFVDWPADADVHLAAAATCTITSGASVVAALNAAKQNTYFVENGVTYSLSAGPVLPGDRGCATGS